MEWQSLIAILLALACGAWAAWRCVRPFVRRDARCGDCGGCPPDLLQIESGVAETPSPAEH